MKKIIALIITGILIFSMGTVASAAGATEYLGALTFEAPQGFKKIEQTDEKILYQNPNNKEEKFSIFALDYNYANSITDISEEYLLYLISIDEESLEEDFPIPGINVTITNSKHEYKPANAHGVNIYYYAVGYVAKASGYNDYYGAIEVYAFAHSGKLYLMYYENNRTNTNPVAIAACVHSARFPAASSSAIKIVVNGEYVYPDSEPVIVNDRTLVPIRAVAEKIGFDVSWEPLSRMVTITNDEYRLRLYIGTLVMYKEGIYNSRLNQSIVMDVDPQIINDRTYLPLRAIGEALGCIVTWEPYTRTVVISN